MSNYGIIKPIIVSGLIVLITIMSGGLVMSQLNDETPILYVIIFIPVFAVTMTFGVSLTFFYPIWWDDNRKKGIEPCGYIDFMKWIMRNGKSSQNNSTVMQK